ncbi:17565_t:CDS:1, partial [Gigaspora margarita]
NHAKFRSKSHAITGWCPKGRRSEDGPIDKKIFTYSFTLIVSP